MADKVKTSQEKLEAEGKEHALEYLVTARAEHSEMSQAFQIRLALLRYILDEADVQEQPKRQAALRAFMNTPTWFGASANAMQNCDGYVKHAKREIDVSKITA